MKRLELFGPCLLALAAASCGLAQSGMTEEDYDRNARRAAPRDAFPVLDEPAMKSAPEADRFLFDSEPVIGLTIGGEARAYPISVMGRHELANDTCGGKPIAVSW